MPELDLVTAEELNLRVYIEDSIMIELEVLNQDGTPYSFVGHSLIFYILQGGYRMSTEPQGGITITGDDNNIIRLNKPALLQKGQYEYRMQVTKPDGQKVTFFYGKLNVVNYD